MQLRVMGVAVLTVAMASLAQADRPAPLKPKLDRAAIQSGTASAKERVLACGTSTKAKGSLKIAVMVNPDGTVASVVARQSPSQALSACVAEVYKAITFEATVAGGSFAYPYQF